MQEVQSPDTSLQYCFSITLICGFWLKAQKKCGLITQHYSLTHQSAIAELISLCTSTREKERAGLPCSHDGASLKPSHNIHLVPL